VSLFAKNSIDSGIEQLTDKADTYLVDAVKQRSISAYVEYKSGIRHESPQVIMLYKGQVFWYASHGDVRLENIEAALEELQKVV